jgi:hypothetical protein
MRKAGDLAGELTGGIVARCGPHRGDGEPGTVAGDGTGRLFAVDQLALDLGDRSAVGEPGQRGVDGVGDGVGELLKTS